MTVEIIPIPLRVETCYVLRDAGVIAIDAGPRGKAEQLVRRLLEAGARIIYPAHGKPFPADVIRRAIA